MHDVGTGTPIGPPARAWTVFEAGIAIATAAKVTKSAVEVYIVVDVSSRLRVEKR